MSAKAITAAQRAVLEDHGLPVGSTLENRVTWRLHCWGILDRYQHRVGRYRLDYAWPTAKIALEVDGLHHRNPDNAARDVMRDAWLRSQGWLVYRIDDTGGTLDDQLARAVSAIRGDVAFVAAQGSKRRTA